MGDVAVLGTTSLTFFILFFCFLFFFCRVQERDRSRWKNHIQQRWRWRRLLFFFVSFIFFEIVSFCCLCARMYVCELSFHNLLKNYQVSSVSYLLHHTHLFHTPKWWCPHRILGSVCFGFSLARSREGANCGWPRVPFVSTSLRRDLLPLVLIINIMFITFL